MYHAYTADDYRRRMGVPLDYVVDGLVCYGTMPLKGQRAYTEAAITALGLHYAPVVESGWLESVYDIGVHGRRVWLVITLGGAFLSSVTQLACMFGSRANIVVGTCGGLQPGRRMGDMILAESSYGDESTTRTYQRDNAACIYHADAALTTRLENRLLPNYVVRRGKLTTCQAMHGETWEDVISWSKQGFDGVEMESSTLFAVSNHYNVPCAALVSISDNLIEQESLMDDHVRERLDDLRVTGTTVLQIAVPEAASFGQQLL